MKGVNRHIIVGMVAMPPEIRTTQSGKMVANLKIPTQDGEALLEDGKRATTWHKVIVFGKIAEFVSKYVEKGDIVYIEGSTRMNNYTDKTGTEKYYMETVSYRLDKVSYKKENSNSKPPYPAKESTDLFSKSETSKEDDLPF